MRQLARLLPPALSLLLVPAAPALAWGPVAHQAVQGEAIDTLPPGLKPWYKKHRLEMPTLALEPQIPEEGTDRRFAIDRLGSFPFSEAPRQEKEAAARLGEDAARAGRLPWLVQESYHRLVEAFRGGDKDKILAESDVLAGLVADLHNPLGLTDNADGQKTGQHGLWARFTVRLPEAMQKRLKLSPDAAHFLDDPNGHVFGIVNATYIWLDNLLYREDLARRGTGGYSDTYYTALEEKLGGLLKDRLSEAASAAGSYWYTAWTEAGRPELK